MNDWINHPDFRTIDPLKQELIRAAARQTQGKSGKSLAPIMMALINSAGKHGIQFSPNEISLILRLLKEGKSPEEQTQIDQMQKMVSSCFSKAEKPFHTS